MTTRKYRRLLAVLCIPLLAAGALFFTVVVRPPSSVEILCTPFLASNDSCKWATFEGQFGERLRKEYPVRFDIQARPFERNKFPFAYASGSRQIVTGATVLEVEPYAGTTDGPGSPIAALRSRRGESITIIFGGGGNREDDERLLNPLQCNELDLTSYPNAYIAGLCGVPQGVAKVKFVLNGDDNAQLAGLKPAIDAVVAEARNNLLLHYALGTPLFLILFLIGSGLVWAIRRASAYVAAG